MTHMHRKYCSLPIDFSDDCVSVKGKRIPLDAETGLPHNCIARPARKTTKCHHWHSRVLIEGIPLTVN